MKKLRDIIKSYRVPFVLILLFVIMIIGAERTRLFREKIVYAESLDEELAYVEGEVITLRDFAVYVAHQEAMVQEEAIIYNIDNTRAYWNIHTNGTYISHAARSEAMSMAIHDILFYHLYKELELTMSETERAALENDVEDFWSDLREEGKELRLGICREDVYNTMYKIACSQKAQSIYAGMYGVSYEEMDFCKEEFLKFLENYEYKVEEHVLNRLDFGDITLVH